MDDYQKEKESKVLLGFITVLSYFLITNLKLIII